MHTAVSLKPAALKMSVCSDFVEHVWKPGSCKNCFHPRGSHGRRQSPSELQATGSQAQLQGLHGILRNKAENVHEDDGGVTASPYSKPTIAVKPTMISSEVSDTWSETTMTAESIPQVSWRKISSKHSNLRTEVDHRTLLDHFGNREPFSHIAVSGAPPQHAPGYSTLGLHSPDRKMDRSIPFGSPKFAGGVGGQEDKAHFLFKDNVTTAQGTSAQAATVSRETRSGSSINSTGYLCIQTRENGVSGGNGCSASYLGDGGDYCQITNGSTGVPLPHDASPVEGRKTWRDGTSPTMGLCIQGVLASSRAAAKSSREDHTFLNSRRGHKGDRYVADSLQNNASPDWKKTTSLPQLISPSDISAYTSSVNSPIASPQEGTYYHLSGELESRQHPDKENYGKTQRNPQNSNVTEPVLAQQAQASKSEPIYAESTKRKKGLQGNVARTPAKSVGPSSSSCTKLPGNACGEGAPYWSNSQAPHDASTQMTARITVMAAHTEEDNRTIYLSSPDSAVSIQWACTSPASNQEFTTLSPSFQWLEDNKGVLEMGENENGHTGRKPVPVNPPEGSPSIPPKMSKNGLPPCDSHHVPLASSPVSTLSDDMKPASSRTSHGASTCGNSKSRSPQRSFAEEPNRLAIPMASERRHKYFHAAWSRQGRIEEEEEEEALSHHTKARGGEPRSAGPFKSSIDLADEGPPTDRVTRMGMSKSASCPYEFTRDRSDIEEFPLPPPPPPKKQSRPITKDKSSCDLEKQSLGSAGSLTPPSQAINVSFITSSTDSLSSDSRTCSDGGQSNEGIHSPAQPQGIKKSVPPLSLPVVSNGDTLFGGSLQPPPLPQKKTVGRAASAPDNTFWGQASPGHQVLSPTRPRLNTSQSESNVFHQEAGQFSCPSSPCDSQHLFSSSESLEKVCRGHGQRSEAWSRPCLQGRAAHSFSSSQLNMSSQASTGSSLQLHHLLSNIDSKEGMYAKLGGLYAESLRRLVTKCEDCFMGDQKTELRFSENSWSLFKLTCNKPCCDSGDAIYYCAICAKDPENTYAVKICKTEGSKTASYCGLSLPVHFNVQQDCGHFLATVPFSMLQSTKTINPSTTNSVPQDHATGSEQECVVVITREVPLQTAADFVKDSASSHNAQPEIYERQVCFLLLQLCNGLEHLKEHGIIHRDLCLENLLLSHCQSSVAGRTNKEDKRLSRLIISNFSKAKQRSGSNNSKLKRDQARLAPEIVSASQYKKFDEFQTGILIYELLHQSNPFEVRAHLREEEYSQEDLPPVPNLSLYSKGLQQLAHLLLEADPIKRIRITEAKRVLQCLLWGPRKDLADQPFGSKEALRGALQNWIDMKRALLMMKFAERAVDPERGIELEDWLCCQYLASTDPCYLFHTLRLLNLL